MIDFIGETTWLDEDSRLRELFEGSEELRAAVERHPSTGWAIGSIGAQEHRPSHINGPLEPPERLTAVPDWDLDGNEEEW